MDDLISRQAAIDALASRWGRPVILTGVDKGDSRYYPPFQLLDGYVAQFIREAIEDEPEEAKE